MEPNNTNNTTCRQDSDMYKKHFEICQKPPDWNLLGALSMFKNSNENYGTRILEHISISELQNFTMRGTARIRNSLPI